MGTWIKSSMRSEFTSRTFITGLFILLLRFLMVKRGWEKGKNNVSLLTR